MSFAQPLYTHDRAITLRDVLVPLIRSGLVEAQEAEKWLKLWARSGEHPLSLLADVTIPDRRSPGKNITFDEIGTIIARSLKMEYLRVDPVKVILKWWEHSSHMPMQSA